MSEHESGAGPRRAAGVILWKRTGAGVLWLLLRNAREGHWGFAKGHLDPGEGELAGALREVREETGLRPRLDPAFRDVIQYDVPATKKRPAARKEVVSFLGSVGERDEVRASDEHDRVEWLALEPALARLAHEQLRGVLKSAARFQASR